MNEKTNLKESLKFIDIFFISLGYIIGAGVYSLMYLTTKYSGKYTWLAFVLGGVISLMTAFSYRDLSEHFDTNASDYDYVTQGISMKLKYPISYLLIILGILYSAVLVAAFTNITKEIYKSAPYFLVILLVTVLPALINIYDVKFTSNINLIITTLKTLVIIVLILLNFSNKDKNYLKVKDIDLLKNIRNIFKKFSVIVHGAFLTFFAYSGFETIPKLAEETENSKVTIPRAIISSIFVTIFLYVLVSISLNDTLGVKKVSETKNPISLAFKYLLGDYSKPVVDFITLLSIFNTILITVLGSSRQIKAISEKNIIPNIFSNVNKKTKTPINSILLITVLILVFVLIFNINISSHLVNLLLATLFVLVNTSNIMLYNKNVIKKDRPPYYSYVGLFSTIYIIYGSIKKLI